MYFGLVKTENQKFQHNVFNVWIERLRVPNYTKLNGHKFQI
jgi:hypothetical protein